MLLCRIRTNNLKATLSFYAQWNALYCSLHLEQWSIGSGVGKICESIFVPGTILTCCAQTKLGLLTVQLLAVQLGTIFAF